MVLSQNRINRGTPSNHPCYFWIFHYKPSILGYPHLWKRPYNLYICIYIYTSLMMEFHLDPPCHPHKKTCGAQDSYVDLAQGRFGPFRAHVAIKIPLWAAPWLQHGWESHPEIGHVPVPSLPEGFIQQDFLILWFSSRFQLYIWIWSLLMSSTTWRSFEFHSNTPKPPTKMTSKLQTWQLGWHHFGICFATFFSKWHFPTVSTGC